MMKGYAYLDLDNNLVYKPAEYIDSDNPYFFIQNSHLVVKKWKFDTQDFTSMENMLRSFTDLKIDVSRTLEFLQCISFHPNDLKTLKQDASKV